MGKNFDLDRYTATGTASKAMWVDVPKKVAKKITEMLDKAAWEKRIVNWEDLYDYCMELFELPAVTIIRAIEEARRKTKYKLL